jgi:gentisate 1,2-dioxygenase
MNNPIDMASLPAQKIEHPQSEAQARALFFNSGNAFNVKLSPVPPTVFDEPLDQALMPDADTSWYACDQSVLLGCDFPATTPLMLARYARIAPGAMLEADFVATGSICYVIEGSGQCLGGDEELNWKQGDIFLLPGSENWQLRAGATCALLWVVTNEPQLAFDGSAVAKKSNSHLKMVHYTANGIEQQFALLGTTRSNADTAGQALIFSSLQQEAGRNIMPSLTLSYNTLPAQSLQRPHKHNSAAVTLVIKGTDCHSLVAGQRCAWKQWTTMVTPPGAPHSHHNEGDQQARFLIVQDGGLHYFARTMGFAFL